MPIINKGVLDTRDIFNRAIGNDWPTAQVTTTADVVEVSSNLYYTNARVQEYLSQNDITVKSLTIDGDLLVQGNTTTLNTATLVIEDKNIFLANGAVNSAAADGAGISIDGAQANIVYVSTGDKFSINKAVEIQGYVALTSNNTTTDLVEGSNLYYTNSRVESYLAAAGYLSAANILANVSLAANTTNDLAEGSNNLYFTVQRARDSFTEGTGIAISANGIISTRGDDVGLGAFNSGLNLAGNIISKTTYQNVKSFTSVEGNSFIAFSFHITNISSNTAYLTGRYVIESNTVLFANLLEIPVGTSIEVFTKPQIFKANDVIQIIGYDNNLQPANDIISSYLSYQGTPNYTFQRSAITVNDNGNYTVIETSLGAQIVESLKLINLESNSMPVTVTITDINDNLAAYLTSNLIIPPFTTVEICEYPKSLPDNYKLKVQKFDNPRAMSIVSSSKRTSTYEIEPSTLVIGEGDSMIFDIRTKNVLDGTVLYYEIQEV
jgi:hypothetical protein